MASSGFATESSNRPLLEGSKGSSLVRPGSVP
jgi:hypothetical protein